MWKAADTPGLCIKAVLMERGCIHPINYRWKMEKKDPMHGSLQLYTICHLEMPLYLGTFGCTEDCSDVDCQE